jgi:hypothetical protein
MVRSELLAWETAAFLKGYNQQVEVMTNDIIAGCYDMLVDL